MSKKKADVEGVVPSTTTSMLSSVPNPARSTVKKRHQLELSIPDSKVFVDAALNPRPVNARLRETVRRYRELAGI